MIKPKFQDYNTPQDYINEGIIPIEPMSAKEEGRADRLAEMMYSTRYIAEDKLDGTRATIHIYKDHIRVFSRRISKKTGWYTENTDLLPHIRDIAIPELAGTILDAELVMPSGEFKDIASTMNCNWEKAVARQEQLGKVEAKVFDIIYYKDRDMQDTELYARKKALKRAVELIDSLYITEVRWFDKKRPVVVAGEMRAKLWEKKEVYPTFYKEVMKECGIDNCKALKSNIFFLSKEAYYEYYVMNGGEGIILKDKKGMYRQTRGREYTKVKKFTTKDVVVVGYSPPTKEYLGKHERRWLYWENKETKEIVDFEKEGDRSYAEFDEYYGSHVNKEDLKMFRDEWLSQYEPISKFHAKNWIGTVRFAVAVTEEELQTWKKINPKETPSIHKIDNVYYLEIGETSGMTEEERIYVSNHKEELIGTVIEVKAHEVILKTGRLRHPRFFNFRYDKAPEVCTMTDHLGG